MFNGGPAPLVKKTSDDEEEMVRISADDLWTAEQIGLSAYGEQAVEKMWELWTHYGAARADGIPESPKEQEERYRTNGNSESFDLQPGLPQHQFRAPDVIVTCGMDYLVRTWEPQSFQALQKFEGHTNFVTVVEPYRGDMLISSSDDNSLRVWRLGDAEWGELVWTIWVSFQGIKSMCVLPGHRVATGSLDFYFRVVSILTGEILHTNTLHYDTGPDNNYWQEEGCGQVWSILHLRFNIVVTASDDTTLRFWDIDKWEPIGPAHSGHFGWGDDIGAKSKFAQTFAPVWKLITLGDGGNRIASSSYDRTVVIWNTSDIHNVHTIRTLRGHENSVISLVLLDKEHLASCSGDNSVKIWNFDTGACLHTIPTHGFPNCGIRIDGDRFAIGGGDCSIRLYNWKEKRDELGEGGFYAHEFSVQWMSRVFFEDADDSNFIDPIMYRTTLDYRKTAWEATFGLEYQKQMSITAQQWQAKRTNPDVFRQN